MLRNLEPIQDRGLAQIRSEYPQTHVVKGKHADLVTVPGFRLCSGWETEGRPANICTVLFERPAGFPAARPDQEAAMAAFEGAKSWNGTQLFVPGAQWQEAARRAICTYLRKLNETQS